MFTRVDVINALYYLFRIINFLILVRVLMSWINPNPRNPIVQLVYAVTEPIIGPVRHLIYNVFGYKGMIDFSPIVAIFLMQIIFSTLLRFL